MMLAVKAMKGLMTAAKNLYTLVPKDESSLARKFIGVCDENEPYRTCGAKALEYFTNAEWSLHQNHLNHISDNDAATMQRSHNNFLKSNSAPTPYSTAREPPPPGDDDGN